MKIECVLFEEPGSKNTETALKIAKKTFEEFNASKVIVASTTGATALKALEIVGHENLIVVSHAFGFYEENIDEMDEKIRRILAEKGVPVVTTSHTLAGFARAVRRKFNTYLVEDIVASVLRTACEGYKVAYELATMVADVGLVRTGDRVVCVAGTGEGADTVVLMRAANSHNFFELKMEAVIAKPL